MRSVLVAVGTVLLAALAACAPVAAGSGVEAGGPLLPSLQIYTAGEEVHFVLQVTNTATSPVTVAFRDGQSYDFLVREGDREIWRWSEGQSFTQAVREETFGAGESRTYEGMWRPPNPMSGELVGIGRFTSSDRWLELATRFALP